MTNGIEIQKAIDGLVNTREGKTFDYAITLVDGVVPGTGLAKDIKNHIQQDRIIKVLTMLNDKEINLESMFKEIQHDENLFDIFYKLIAKCIENGSKIKREINMSLFIDYYRNPDLSKSTFSFSLMDSISLLTNQEIEILFKLMTVLKKYMERNKINNNSRVSVAEVYEALDKKPIDDLGCDYDLINYMFSRLSYAGFLIVPYGAVIGATVFSHLFNMTILKNLFNIVDNPLQTFNLED